MFGANVWKFIFLGMDRGAGILLFFKVGIWKIRWQPPCQIPFQGYHLVFYQTFSIS
jgi:hypothetical protein